MSQVWDGVGEMRMERKREMNLIYIKNQYGSVPKNSIQWGRGGIVKV